MVWIFKISCRVFWTMSLPVLKYPTTLNCAILCKERALESTKTDRNKIPDKDLFFISNFLQAYYREKRFKVIVIAGYFRLLIFPSLSTTTAVLLDTYQR
jgi:hypothetical protein